MEERIIHTFLSLDEEIYVGKLYAQKTISKEIYSIELNKKNKSLKLSLKRLFAIIYNVV